MKESTIPQKKIIGKKWKIAPNALHVRKEKIYFAYVSKHKSKHEKTSYSFNDFKRTRIA